MPTLKEKERTLYEAYRSGDNKAKAELLTSLNPLVFQQVNKFKGSGLPDMALKLEARRLTSNAIDNYDPSRSQLNTHVTNQLKKLSRFVMNYQNIGHIPEPRILMIGKYNTIFDNLQADLGRDPTVVELADAMQVSIAEIERLQLELRKDLSMTVQEDDEEGGFYFYQPNADLDQKTKQIIEFVYYDATPTDKKIMEYMFGMAGVQKLTSKEIGMRLNLSPNQLKKHQLQIAQEIKQLI